MKACLPALGILSVLTAHLLNPASCPGQSAPVAPSVVSASDSVWSDSPRPYLQDDDLISVGHWNQSCDSADQPCDVACDAIGATSGCQGDLWTRSNLAGDWGGVRTVLTEHGIVANLSLTQFYQGVVSGGRQKDFEYGGKLDYIFTLEGAKLGLNEGFFATIHAETRYGRDPILESSVLAPSNANMLYPEFDDSTAITELQIMQAFSEEWAVTFGKFNAFDFLNMVYPQTGRGIDGFMNLSTFLPMTLVRTVPLSFLGAGVVKLNEKRVQGALLVYDSNNITTTSGFDELFDNGANILGMYRIFTELGGKPGSHGLLATWANGTYTSLDRTDWTFLPPLGLMPGSDTGTWSAVYIAEQQIWADSRNPHRNIGLLSEWGLADPRTTPFDWSANVALQGQGLMECRPADTAGVAWFYNGISDDLKQLTSPLLRLEDVHGLEVYYNAAITPWFHLTVDLQYVDPSLARRSDAFIFGLRGKLDL
ncbi:carbohydrate porin [Maioricimonas sp. JC845]|uniref:carbohydrate porin n=1 Tax=Maioricimonas sp. JC845 TaxID=3232138 RepID=UPI0034593286